MESIILWLNDVTQEDIKNILISIPGIVLGAFSIYFAYQKIGNKVLVSYATSFSRINENRISELELINEKNKPISIFSIHAVINQDIVVELDKFDTPLILKPLESIQLSTPAFSALYVGNERYKAEYNRPNKLDIYLITHKDKIKCKVINPPSLNAVFDFEHYRNAAKDIRTFNGRVYNENVKYAIIYRYDTQEYTALVEDWGFIAEGWNFRHNQIPKEFMGSSEKVKEYLVSLGYDKLFSALHVDRLDE